VREVTPGGCLIFDSTWPRSSLLARDDIRTFGVPFAQLCNENFEGARARTLMKNIMYAGTLAALIDLDLEVIRSLLAETFAKKPALVDSNMKAIEIGYRYAREHFECPLAARIERMDATKGHVMIDGNTAAALGCVYAGATVGAWYPITPSTSLMDAFRSFCGRHRTDPKTGRRDYMIVQAEDELAAIGIVIGAMWNGARAFTPTSGPGISLMEEFIGLAYYAEVPAVIFDVQRVGPSTGMPTRTQQCDLIACAYASHGDTRHVLLFPDSPEECFQMAVQAFDLAERLQTPVFVLLDLDIGMNEWMAPEFRWDDSYRPDRGKVLTPEQIEGLAKFQRYMDPDGDGIPYRTLPGISPKASYFTRFRPQQVRRLHRGSGAQHGLDHHAEIRDRREVRAAGGDRRRNAATATSARPATPRCARHCRPAKIRARDRPGECAVPLARGGGIGGAPTIFVEQNCDAQCGADPGDGRGKEEAAFDTSLRRPADVALWSTASKALDKVAA
jgi:2-oxoglutarate ferredoxin oxidoreductase subunit alpha